MIMKTKITSVLILLAASAFAFAESAPQASVPADAGKPALRERGKHRGPQAQRGAMIMRILLTLSNEQLDELSKRVEEVRKMTPEQKAEALKALPKPELRRPRSLGREFRENRNERGPRGRGMPAPKGKPDNAE